MKASSGQYFPQLDHVRALAAFTVFAWHFNHFNDGYKAPPLAFPLSFLTEGHTGVAIFMALSGYLFAKLLDGQTIRYGAFLWNRALRLLPLLVVAMALAGLEALWYGTLDSSFFRSLAGGVVFPTLPNGGWSITVEFHFYLVLPLILLLARKSKYYLLLLLAVPILARAVIYEIRGEVQYLAYYTILGRLDQFILGIFAFHARDFFAGRHWLAAAIAAGFLVFWFAFDSAGGFYMMSAYPSPSPIWIVLTTVEGLAYSSLIAWYDNSFVPSEGKLSRFIAMIGAYSYSIYLFHFFLVFRMVGFIHNHVIPLSNPYLLIAMSVPCFLAMVPVALLSFRFIEKPFLSFRKRYVISEKVRDTVGDMSPTVRNPS